MGHWALINRNVFGTGIDVCGVHTNRHTDCYFVLLRTYSNLLTPKETDQLVHGTERRVWVGGGLQCRSPVIRGDRSERESREREIALP